ncbi:MAG TPA: cell division ATP-binding protein FtsE [Patescibacteria group bacterium]|nr:cell division ATP-binding protein FtsE [Patescibacteria group bacterium]
MIVIKNLTKVYPPKIIALDDFSAQIESGEFISLVGPSGAGKSTLIRMLIAQERPTKGQILIGDKDITRLSRRHVPYYRRKIGVVWQDFKLLQNKTIFENVAYALEVVEKSQAEINARVPKILKLVGLEGKEDRFPRELSGGEIQRAAIARALVHDPHLLIADEPTGNLDPVNTEDIVKLLLKINKLGTTVILATHNKDVVDNLRKRVIVLEDGKLISDKKLGRYQL